MKLLKKIFAIADVVYHWLAFQLFEKWVIARLDSDAKGRWQRVAFFTDADLQQLLIVWTAEQFAGGLIRSHHFDVFDFRQTGKSQAQGFGVGYSEARFEIS